MDIYSITDISGIVNELASAENSVVGRQTPTTTKPQTVPDFPIAVK